MNRTDIYIAPIVNKIPIITSISDTSYLIISFRERVCLFGTTGVRLQSRQGNVRERFLHAHTRLEGRRSCHLAIVCYPLR